MTNKFNALNLILEHQEGTFIKTQTDIYAHSQQSFDKALEHIRKVIKTQSKNCFSKVILTIQLEELIENRYKAHETKRYIIEFYEGCSIEHRPYDELEGIFAEKSKEQYSSVTKQINELFKELKIIFEINVNYK